jgi:hypothetical protein
LPLPFLAVACGQPNSGTTPDVNDQSLRPTRVPPTHDNAVRAPAVAASRETGSPLNIIPTSLALPGDSPGYQLVAQRRRAAGEPEDVTCAVKWSVDAPEILSVEPGGYLKPLSEGIARIRAQDAASSAEIQVEVASRAERSWDFAGDVVPIFTRLGCNSGGCHGRAGGQNGFHLSLFGYDAEGDYRALTREAGARRLDRFRPVASLLLRKATGQAQHGGGVRLGSGSQEYKALIAWIAAGAPLQSGQTHGALTAVRVEPAALVLPEPGARQLRVVARFEDGHERDVTRLALYRSNDDSLAQVDQNGLVEFQRRGEVDLIVRYQSRVVSARLATVVNPDLHLDFASLPRNNFIDDHVYKRLSDLKVPPSPPAGDAAFLRRVSLDLTGQLPQPDEVKAFSASTDPAKRANKVAELMRRIDFLAFWKLKLGDLLQISQARFGNGAGPFEGWLDQKLEEATPWDKMVIELLTALGNPADPRTGGPVNFALDGADPSARAENTARRFLGLRLRCAQCHDHPFDVWTQDDYYGLSAFFAKVGRGGATSGPAMNLRLRVELDPKGEVIHLRTKQPALARFLGGADAAVAPGEDPRKVLADWITAPDNPFFARAMANWVWAQFFGRGVVDPPDDMSAANPPVHPELLDALARHFVSTGYDLRDLIRTIAESEIYGLASATLPGNERDTRLFSHHTPRPLSAHQMADALALATQVPNVFAGRGLRAKTKAIEIFDPSSPSVILDTFGRCGRTEACSSVATPQLSLRQALLLIGGDAIDGKVSNLNGYLAHMLELGPAPEEIVEYLYMRTLCRPPTDEERSHWEHELESAASLREAAEDLFWALLNSREFAFNH